MNKDLLLTLLVCCALLSACSKGKDSPRGFSLPEGNEEAGKAAFVALQCNVCHATQDVEQLRIAGEPEISVTLGGSVSRVKTYAELVTSIINPSHRLALGYPAKKVATGDTSRMRNYNDEMTVNQLINLVSYLQPQYQLEPYIPTAYPIY